MKATLLSLISCAAAHDEIISLHGAGTTNPSKLFWELLGLVQARAKFAVHATYRAVGSSTGQKEFLGASNGNVALNHFGSGDIPMTASRYEAVAAAGRTMVHVPFAMGGIGVFHSAPVGGASVHLTACVLAKIFSLEITMWNNGEIAALNTGLALPAVAIKVVHRVKGSSSTAGFTEYMAQTCPASWTATGSTIAWAEGTFEGQGSDGMSKFIEENEGAIGYIDAGHGHEHGLSEVALLNKANKYLTTKEADIGAAGTQALAMTPSPIPTDPTADWSAVNLYNLGGDKTWPITMISYFYLEKDLSAMDPQTAALLLAFVNFVLSDEGQSKAEDNMFVRLPAALQTYNADTLASLTLPAGYAALSFELASATQVEVGAGMNVLSGKRREYGEWDRARMGTQIDSLLDGKGEAGANGSGRSEGAGQLNSHLQDTITQLHATITQMQANLTQLQAKMVVNPASASPPPSTSLVGGDSDDDSSLSIAALVVALLSLVLGGLALVIVVLKSGHGKPVQREISFTKSVELSANGKSDV